MHTVPPLPMVPWDSGVDINAAGEPPTPTLYAKRKKRKGVAVLLIAAGLVVFAGAGIATYALQSKSSPAAHRVVASKTVTAHNPTATTPTVPASTSTTIKTLGQQQAQALNDLLTQSTANRSQVQSATTEIAVCGNLAQAQQTLQSSASSRQTLLNSLNELQISQLPNSSQLFAALSSAWTNSMNSDSSYAGWAQDESNNINGCVQNDTSDASYVQAQSTDAAATAAKQSFVTLWNPIAAQYGLPQLTASQI